MGKGSGGCVERGSFSLIADAQLQAAQSPEAWTQPRAAVSPPVAVHPAPVEESISIVDITQYQIINHEPLPTPSPKQVEVLALMSEDTAIDEIRVGERIDITRQAAISRLSGLVRSGWCKTIIADGFVYWYLTDRGAAAVGFFHHDS